MYSRNPPSKREFWSLSNYLVNNQPLRLRETEPFMCKDDLITIFPTKVGLLERLTEDALALLQSSINVSQLLSIEAHEHSNIISSENLHGKHRVTQDK